MKNKIITAVFLLIVFGMIFPSYNETPFTPTTNEVVKKEISQPFVSWQKIETTITEADQKIAIDINVPRVFLSDSSEKKRNLQNQVNNAIARYVESLKDDFVRGVSTAAENNGETNTLDISTEILLNTPRLLSLAFTATGDMAGINDSDSERTFLVFDWVNGELMRKGTEMFHDHSAWARAVEIVKPFLISKYKGDLSCDLSYAPRPNGLAASCIGVDWSQGGSSFSVTGDVPIAMIQEFLSPSVLSDVV